MQNNIQITGYSSTFACGVLKDEVAISIWRGAPSITDFDKQVSTINKVVSKNPKKCAFLSIIEESSPRPSQEIEQRAGKMFHDFGKELGAVAYVMEGAPVRAAFVIGVMMGMTILKGTPQPSKSFKDIIAASTWIDQTTTLSNRLLIQSGVDQIRSAITV